MRLVELTENYRSIAKGAKYPLWHEDLTHVWVEMNGGNVGIYDMKIEKHYVKIIDEPITDAEYWSKYEQYDKRI